MGTITVYGASDFSHFFNMAAYQNHTTTSSYHSTVGLMKRSPVIPTQTLSLDNIKCHSSGTYSPYRSVIQPQWRKQQVTWPVYASLLVRLRYHDIRNSVTNGIPFAMHPRMPSASTLQMFKGQLQWKKSNRQNYKRRAVYLETSKFQILVYYCNVCTRRKKIEIYVIKWAEYQLLGAARVCRYLTIIWGLSTLCFQISDCLLLKANPMKKF